jgi:hypothetical protein
MRIESAVGCPISAGDSAEEKTVPDGSTGLFTNILDCFRALVSGAASEDAAAVEEPAAGKPCDRNPMAAADASAFQAIHETSAVPPKVVRAGDPTVRKDGRELSASSPVPLSIGSDGSSFGLTVPGFVGKAQPGSAIPATAASQTGALTAAAARMPPGLSQHGEVPGLATDRQAGALVGHAVARTSDAEAGEESTASTDGAADAGLDPGGLSRDYEPANPQSPAQAASQATLPVTVHATATALAMNVNVLQPDGSSVNAGSTPSPSSSSAPSNAAKAWNRVIETGAGSPSAPVAPWAPQRNSNAGRAAASQAGDRTVKSQAAPDTSVAPEGSSAYARVIRVDDGTVPPVDANVEARFTGSDVPAQKLPDKVFSATSGPQADRQGIGDRIDTQPDSPGFRADKHLPSQGESAARPAGTLKTAAVVDPATQAAELEKVSAGRVRPRPIGEGGAREDSAMSSLSGVTREAQVPSQATTGVKDVKAPALVFEVAERISTVATGGRGEVTIQLKPDQFGRMSIVAESGAAGILARITTESASLKQYLESNLPVLHQALQDQGLKVERIEVLVQEGLLHQQSANQWQHNFGHASGGHDTGSNGRLAAASPAPVAQPANEITLDAVTQRALHPHSTFHTVA